MRPRVTRFYHECNAFKFLRVGIRMRSPQTRAPRAQVPALFSGSPKPGSASYQASHTRTSQPGVRWSLQTTEHRPSVECFLRASLGAGGTQRLPRIVGRTAAKELIFTGRRINGSDALRMGLVDHLAAEGQTAEDRALQLARDIAQVLQLCKVEHLLPSSSKVWRCAEWWPGLQGAPIALRMAKAAIESGLDVDLASGLRLEQAYYAQVQCTAAGWLLLDAIVETLLPGADATVTGVLSTTGDSDRGQDGGAPCFC